MTYGCGRMLCAAAAAGAILLPATTAVLVGDGGTVVLGGLFENDVAKAKAKLPILADIPLLGQLFRNTTKEDRKTELLIFVTPRVILAEEE